MRLPIVRIAAVILILSLPIFSAWDKQGILNGNITDVQIESWGDGNDLIYVSTDGAGIFLTIDGINWVEANGEADTKPLPDYNVKAITLVPGRPDWLIAACQSGVYITDVRGDLWYDFAPGLFGNTGGNPIPTDIAAADLTGSGDLVFYLTSANLGVFRKFGTSSSPWQPFNIGMKPADTYALAVAAYGDRALVGTKYRFFETSGNLYSYDSVQDQWMTSKNVPDKTTYLSIDYPGYNLALVGTGFSVSVTGRTFGGMYYAQDGENFYPLCALSSQPDQPIYSISANPDEYSQATLGKLPLAGSHRELFRIPFDFTPPTCTGPYQSYPFRGKVTGIDIGDPDYCLAVFGGPGKGPFITNPCDLNINPFATRDGIDDYQIADIALSPDFVGGSAGVGEDNTVFAASRIAGLYMNIEEIAVGKQSGYFTRMSGDPDEAGTPDAITIALSPRYGEENALNLFGKTLFIGTLGKGVLRSEDGGRSWEYANGDPAASPDPTNLPYGAIVTDIEIYDKGDHLEIWASVWGKGVYLTEDGGDNWIKTGTKTDITNTNIYSLALDPAGRLFAGCRAHAGTETFHTYNESADEWLETGLGFTYTIRSLTSPLEDNVFIGTEGEGIFHYEDGSGPSISNFSTDLPANATALDLDSNPQSWGTFPQLVAALWEDGLYYYDFGSNGWEPYNSGLPDGRVISVALEPTGGALSMVFVGHARQKLFYGYLNGYSPGSSLVQPFGFFTTPRKINGLAVDPNDPNIVLAATDDMGVFYSNDKGETFRPWSRSLVYNSSGDYYVVDRVLSIEITDPFDPPGSEVYRHALVGTDGHGIFYNYFDPDEDDFYPEWKAATMTPTTTAKINEIRYLSPAEDIRASDTVNGDYHSSNDGQNWSVVPGLTAGLTDISFSATASRSVDGFPGRSLSGFTWGCSTGYSISPVKRAGYCSDEGGAWYFDPAFGSWQKCSTTGLDTCEDFRAILELTSGTILLGAKAMGGGTTWEGFYRSEDSCSTWEVSGEGLPSNPKIYAFQELASGDILAGLDGAFGGVFLSDPSSDGRAWVEINDGFDGYEGTLDLTMDADGTTVYTGMTDDGIYADDSTISYTSRPTAYFEVSANEACVNSTVTFTDYSAGRVDSWSWDFDYNVNPGTDSTATPPFGVSYNTAGTYLPRLTVGNAGPYSDSYGGTSVPEVVVKPEIEVLPIYLSKVSGSPTVLLNEDFEGAFPPSGWAVFNGGSGGNNLTWTTDNPAFAGCSTRAIPSPLSTTVALIDSDCDGNGATQMDRLYTAFFYPGSATTLTLEFDHFFNYISGYGDEHGYIEIYTSSNPTYTTIHDFTGADFGPEHVTIDLTPYLDPTMRIRFQYEGAYDYWWMVDNVTVTGDADNLLMTWSDLGDESGYQVYASSTPASGSQLGLELPADTTSSGVNGSYTYYRLMAKGASYVCGDGPAGGAW